VTLWRYSASGDTLLGCAMPTAGIDGTSLRIEATMVPCMDEAYSILINAVDLESTLGCP
jgi:hypothetical protein